MELVYIWLLLVYCSSFTITTKRGVSDNQHLYNTLQLICRDPIGIRHKFDYMGVITVWNLKILYERKTIGSLTKS